jgi:RNA polymerase sigma-70 factor, ECF subfamily
MVSGTSPPRLVRNVCSDEKQLIDECLAGRTEAFEQLVIRHQDRLCNALVRVLGSADDADDVAQDAFVQAFQKLATFRGNASFYSWLFRIALNAAASRKRRSWRKWASIEVIREQTGHDPGDNRPEAAPGHALETGERQAAVQSALAQLSEEFRIPLVLREIDGLKYEEISEILDCPIGTVRSRIHRGRSELRRRLETLLHEKSSSVPRK